MANYALVAQNSEHIQWLRGELAAWQREGVITDAQASAIGARYPAADGGSPTGGKLVSVIAMIGAVLVGLGVILLVGANWDGISRPMRLVLLIGAMVGFYAGGWRLRRSGNHDGIASALLLVGTLVFGANLFLIGQMYHVRAHDPLAFLVWALAAGAMAIVLGSRAQGTLAVLALGAWWIYETIVRFADVDDAFAAVLVLSVLGPLGLLALGRAAHSLVARRRAPWLEPLTDPAWVVGFLGTAGLLLVPLSFAHHLGETDVGPGVDMGQVVSMLAGAVAVILAACAVHATQSRERHGRAEAVGMALVAFALVAIALSGEPLFASVLANTAIVIIAIGYIALGIARSHSRVYTAGVAVATIEIGLRYCDLAFSQDQLPGSVAFLGGGVLLLALAAGVSRARAAWLERKGRRA